MRSEASTLAVGRLEFKLEYKYVYLTIVLPVFVLHFSSVIAFILLLVHQEETGEKHTCTSTAHNYDQIATLTSVYKEIRAKNATRCHVCLNK